MSYVGRKGTCSILDIDNSNDSEAFEMKEISKLFSMKQLDLIEAAYEGSLMVYRNWDEDCYEITKAEKYYGIFTKQDERVIAICENIIKNKGTFKP